LGLFFSPCPPHPNMIMINRSLSDGPSPCLNRLFSEISPPPDGFWDTTAPQFSPTRVLKPFSFFSASHEGSSRVGVFAPFPSASLSLCPFQARCEAFFRPNLEHLSLVVLWNFCAWASENPCCRGFLLCAHTFWTSHLTRLCLTAL